ncbi:exodeoxyribonuclease V subunit alpha [Accumulibacter sp.]|uniref:exodeoxyribonuclease V subunit alpha n=1 Tax=Accumulibacter sp. TaxID=2053492 RepID=UPI0025D0A78F|nr:exodeoxyribonuclease V subunit alpha [Accumulibacter sp.]MCM8611083.1 exodeoxyribonuclease V subunit alpha [Accumulibacter sp.]MCM8636197.1 exodeoxyribonuclease V subunit alpha [Accumulibacter sp.]MCM8640596.1 exodeoxyribonuclease V subunit alpha [Accumulibacter sp.]
MAARPEMHLLLRQWRERQWLRPLDVAFADFLWREVPDASPWLILAAALASHQLGRGHACLDLATTLAAPGQALSLPPAGDERLPAAGPSLRPEEVLADLHLAEWLDALAHPALVAGGSGTTPLVLADGRLYLRRYWQYEQDVRAAIERRLAGSPQLRAALPVAAMRATLAALFPPVAGERADWHKRACALAAGSAFSIITGGPGSGKTTTVLRLVALLQALAFAADAAAGQAQRPLRIRLAAPTGKAAARLSAAIARARASLPLSGVADAESVRAAIPERVATLHRLLGARPDTRRFAHHAGNPLPVDLLVIDEASMVDLEMMAAVFAALPDGARLVLLGDRDQLASVEAGAVFGELCRRAGGGHYLPATCDWLGAVSGERITPELVDPQGGALDQAVVMLRHSHRFAAASGIGRLAAAVNAGDRQRLGELWRQPPPDLAFRELAGDDAHAFGELVIDGGQAPAAGSGYRHYLQLMREQQPPRTAAAEAFAAWARAVLAAHGEFQVLCALRLGAWGVAGLNQRIADALHAAGLIRAAQGWYAGRPLLVTRNEYSLGLMNGDIGIVLELPGGAAGESILRVAFPLAGEGQGIRWVLPTRLRAVETAYALTVHKAQGSEFAHAALLLPDTASPVLTRELLYTAITRARSRLTLATPAGLELLQEAVRRRVLRASGLLPASAAVATGPAANRSRPVDAD